MRPPLLQVRRMIGEEVEEVVKGQADRIIRTFLVNLKEARGSRSTRRLDTS